MPSRTWWLRTARRCAGPIDWLSGLFTEVDFGWQSFSGFGADVWVDDLVLGNDRIGCN
jgi:hypothetical protein